MKAGTRLLAPALGAAFILSFVGPAAAQPGQAPPPPPTYGNPAPQPGYGNPAPQPGYQNPPPPPGYQNPNGSYYPQQPRQTRRGFHPRFGLTLGGSLGVGAMGGDNGPIDCAGCDYQPIAGGIDFHIGSMLSPRMALLFEYGGSFQQLDDFGFTYLGQHMFTAAAKFWVLPQFWLKGGVGLTVLNITEDDGFVAATDTVSTGLGATATAGVELLSAHDYAIDLQLRLASGNYESFDTNVNSALVQVGVAWF